MSKFLLMLMFSVLPLAIFGQDKKSHIHIDNKLNSTQLNMAKEDSLILTTPIPAFQNEHFQQWANNFFLAANKAKLASLEGNVERLKQSVTTIIQLHKTLEGFLYDPDYDKLAQFYNDIKDELEAQ